MLRAIKSEIARGIFCLYDYDRYLYINNLIGSLNSASHTFSFLMMNRLFDKTNKIYVMKWYLCVYFTAIKITLKK